MSTPRTGQPRTGRPRTVGPRTVRPRTGPRRSRATILLQSAVIVVALGACTAGPSPEPAANESPIAPSTAAAEVTSVSTFVEPFEAASVGWMGGTPSIDEANLLSWENDDGTLAVRVLAPVSVYEPGAGNATAVPEDFTAYIRSLGDHGAELGDWRDGEVGGRDAVLVTVVTPEGASLDGAFGCPAEGMAADDCYGPQTAYDLRLAVVDGAVPLLFWLRTDIAEVPAVRDAAAVEFERFLDGVVFETGG